MLLQKRGSKTRITAFLLIAAMVAWLIPSNVQTASAATGSSESRSKEVTVVRESEDGTIQYVKESAASSSASQKIRKAKTSQELPKLAKPTNLRWQTEAGTESSQRPGMINWEIPTDGICQGIFDIAIYRSEDNKWVSGCELHAGESDSSFSLDQFIVSDLGSGSYYFTVQSIGDDNTYSSSEVAKSENWTYTKPAQQVSASFTDLKWSWPEYSWNNTSDAEHISGYQTETYFSQTQDGDKIALGGAVCIPSFKDRVMDRAIAENGAGYYFFRVRAISKDITKYQNSDWSEYSEFYPLDATTAEIKSKLEGLKTNDSATADEIKAEVKKLNRNELRSAMLADTGVVDLLQELERKTNVNTGVELESTISDDLKTQFNTGDVKMTGAALNDLTENTTKVTLKIGNPSTADLAIPENYKNAVAVKFSMDAVGIADTSQLAVPIRITLPVPSTINPNFLTILHYDQNGEPETLGLDKLHIYQENGKNFVSFVVDHFSDFAMVAKLPVITFNANGGTCGTSTLTVNKEGVLTEALPTPTRSGYTFKGWYNGETKVDASTKFTADTTLTAKWEQDAASGSTGGGTVTPTPGPSGGGSTTDPSGGITPGTPTTPVDPSKPTEPADPTTPTDPAEPSDPTTPADPSVPTEPSGTETSSPIKQGTKVADKVSGASYRVQSTGKNGGTVVYQKPLNKNTAVLAIPATIKIAGKTYQVTAIAADAFKANKTLRQVKMTKNIKIIGANAFNGCKNLKNVNLGANTAIIGSNAFKNCTKLKSIVIPAKVKTIGAGAFSGCKGLTKMTIKTKTLKAKNIGKNAFKSIPAKAVIKVPKGKAKAYTKALRAKGLNKKTKVK